MNRCHIIGKIENILQQMNRRGEMSVELKVGMNGFGGQHEYIRCYLRSDFRKIQEFKIGDCAEIDGYLMISTVTDEKSYRSYDICRVEVMGIRKYFEDEDAQFVPPDENYRIGDEI